MQGAAKLDIVVEQAADRARDHPVAGQVGEDAPQDVGSMHRPDAGVGPEIAASVVVHLPGDRHLGNGSAQ
jgi:hypothetical protein